MNNLDDLRKKAEAMLFQTFAVKPGSPKMGGVTWILQEQGIPGIRASVIEYQHGPELMEYIAAADPSTVLALIDRCEAAEAAVARVRERIEDYGEQSHSDECGWSDCARHVLDDMRAALDGEDS